MKRALRAVRDFLTPAVAARPLALCRIGISTVLLVQAWQVAHDLLALFGPRGLVQWSLDEAILPPWRPRISWLVEQYGVSPDAAVRLTFAVYVVGLVLLLLGWHTRAAAFVTWLTHMMLAGSGELTTYGVQAFGHIILTYLLVFPSGADLSVDRTPATSGRSWRYGLALRVLQIHLCVVYLFSGVEKGSGRQWWTGEAIWRAVMQPQFAQFDLGWTARFPLILAFAAWGTLLIECGYPFAMWWPRLRRTWVLAAVSLHAGIALFLGLRLFSSMMIVLTVSAFGSDLVADVVRYSRRSIPLLRPRTSRARRTASSVPAMYGSAPTPPS